eukprot:CAMPEP_0185537344 /NCGR_PEP_ID=MMETSP1366-20130426/110397_1 /TAXON_ID=38817 /ORGANISM="Gephyrocapsa oceanica, Strain RCC1303" /LENGTH=244 /DNA_ID=CAMNT_0028149063 /DNA_START=6 /DNA_END=738 /DNA_ORIENTATION=-
MTSEADAFTVSPSRLCCHAVLTSAPALLPFSIASSSAVPLRVTLGSTFGDAVRFQAHDPALAHPPLGAGEGGGPLPGGGGGDSPALLHEMNLISSVALPPRGVVAVVLVFRPAVALTAAEDDQRRRGAPSRHRRRLSLRRAHLPSAVRGAAAAERASVPLSDAVEERELHFSNCVLGAASHKDFTVRNGSEAPLSFRLVPLLRAGRAISLSFTNLDSGAPLRPGGVEEISGFSHARLRAHLTPH